MAEPNTIYKMTILAMLDQVDFPLSNTQISNFFLEQDYTDYFTVQQILSGLLLCEDSELIRAESSHSNTQYYITSAGQDTLKFFGDKISPAIQNDIKAYFEKNKMDLKNENAVVTPLVTREEVQAKESDEFVERTFDGSLPGFLTAFLGGKKLSRQEAEDLKALIDNYQEEG